MTRVPSRNRRAAAGIVGVAALVLAASALAQQVYRYEDPQGRIVYSDKPPPSDARNSQSKRIGANYVETEQAPLATQQAAERYPVTLYTFGCGEVCQTAEGLLNKRGVPFTTVNIEEPTNAAKLQSLTGELTAPVLQVGDKLIAKGYNEARWTSMLDEAGYPKAPAPRRTVPGARPPEPPRDETKSAQPPAKGTGYPAQ